jgi:hypothetical protein
METVKQFGVVTKGMTSNRSFRKFLLTKGSLFKIVVGLFLLSAGGGANASVTVNIKTGNGYYVNDEDSGFYVSDGKDSTRMLEDESFKMPVGSDGMPRWKSCTSSPCAKVPTLDKAPGDKGKKAMRKLTKQESEDIALFRPVVKLPPAIEKLKESMLATESRLNLVSLATLEDAFRPVIDAVGPARQSVTNHQLVSDAEEAIRLKDALYLFWNGWIKATSYSSSGIGLTNCKVLEEGVKVFNQVAGYEAVSYTLKAGAFSWLVGNSACRYNGGMETVMIGKIKTILKRNTTSNQSFSVKGFMKNVPSYFDKETSPADPGSSYGNKYE